ncbi:hypothetical protein [Arthrobacter sp. MAHUQ-56]
MRWDEAPENRSRIRFAAAAETVEGYGGRALNGRALHPADGYLFPDRYGEGWWVIFQPGPDQGGQGRKVPGDILACNDSYGDMVHVLVLARGVWEDDAETAFRASVPVSLADAARVAAAVAHAAAPAAPGPAGAPASPAEATAGPAKAPAPRPPVSPRAPRAAG